MNKMIKRVFFFTLHVGRYTLLVFFLGFGFVTGSLLLAFDRNTCKISSYEATFENWKSGI